MLKSKMKLLSAIPLISTCFLLCARNVVCGTEDDSGGQRVTLSTLQQLVGDKLEGLEKRLNETQSNTYKTFNDILSKVEAMDRRMRSIPTFTMNVEEKLRETYTKTESIELKLSDIYRKMDAIEKGIDNNSKINTDIGRKLDDTQLKTEKMDSNINVLYQNLKIIDGKLNIIYNRMVDINRKVNDSDKNNIVGKGGLQSMVSAILKETSNVNVKVDNIRLKTERVTKIVKAIRKATKNPNYNSSCTNKVKTYMDEKMAARSDVERKLNSIHNWTASIANRIDKTYTAIQNMESKLLNTYINHVNDKTVGAETFDSKTCVCNSSLDNITHDQQPMISNMEDKGSEIANMDEESDTNITDPCKRSRDDDVPSFLQPLDDIVQNFVGILFPEDKYGCSNHAGEEYFMVFPYDVISEPELQILITSRLDTIVDIESPYEGFYQNVMVNATGGLVVTVPLNVMKQNHVGLPNRSQKGISVRSRDSEIFVYGIVSSKSHQDIVFTAIPSKFLSTAYPIIDHTLVIAVRDDTLFNITYRDDQIEPSPDSSKMAQFHTHMLSDSNWTHVKNLVSSNEKITVLSSYFGSAYTTFLFIPPVQSLGDVFIVPHLKTDSTRTKIYSFQNSECIATIHYSSSKKRNYYFRWQRNDRYNSDLPSVVETTLPTILMIYSNDFSGIMIPAISQYSNHYKFLTPFTDKYDHQVILMIKHDDFDCLMLDGQKVNSLDSDIETINVKGTPYNIVYMNITTGQHEVSHVHNDVTFGLIATGTSTDQIRNRKYNFPVGMYLGEEKCTNTR